MQRKISRYTLWTVACVAISLAVFRMVEHWLPSNVPLQSLLWFSVFNFLTGFVTVKVSGSATVVVTPSPPVEWASAAVLGPGPAMVSFAIGRSLAYVMSAVSYHILKYLAPSFYKAVASGKSKEEIKHYSFVWRPIIFLLGELAQNWLPMNVLLAIQMGALNIATSAVAIGVSGAVYVVLGGQVLTLSGPENGSLIHFLLPFLMLVTAYSFTSSFVYLTTTYVLYPMKGLSGFYGFWLRLRMAASQELATVWRATPLLAVVATCFSYLFAKVGAWDFILAALPVLALRDIFKQWTDEREAYENTITTLATYMQYYHPYTRGHLKRVADVSERLARELRLPAESVRFMSMAGLLHDIGKVGVSEEILDKVEKLTDEEWATIKNHPVKGAEILKYVEFFEVIVDWVKYHHKWYNGAGYPDDEVKEDDLPIEAGIIAVADAFDAMTDDRDATMDWVCDSCSYKPDDGTRPEVCPKCGAEKRRRYRQPLTMDQALEEIRRGSGSQFHPRVVKAFLTMIEREGLHPNG